MADWTPPGKHGRAGTDRQDRPAPPWPAHSPGAAGDRKSTRLNSSHVAISYAVFCLKKKKNTRAKTYLRSSAFICGYILCLTTAAIGADHVQLQSHHRVATCRPASQATVTTLELST